ncbi:hypothetical protein [Arcticibacter sp. MXS-1]|uniref:hypothetical protein n=1 Tax=Arcticibacter sp. MXS-1 TaxID=3341726 RepID=UPI0035A910D0
MKTLLRPYLLEFLRSQGYKYLLSRKQTENRQDTKAILLVPVLSKPNLSGPRIGYDVCFRIEGKAEDMNFLYEESGISVLLDRDDVNPFKKYLLKIA